MKFFRYLTALVAVSLAFAACEPEPKDVFETNPVAPKMDAYNGHILMTEGAEEEMVTFTWSEARFVGDVVSYALYASYGEEQVELSNGDKTYYSVLKSELRSALLEGITALQNEENKIVNLNLHVVADTGNELFASEPITVKCFIWGDFVAPVLSVSEAYADGIVLSVEQSDVAISFLNWTLARFGYKTTPNYSVYMTFGDFAPVALAQNISVADVDVYYYNIHVSELNKALIGAGAEIDKAYDVTFYVVAAESAEADAETIESNRVVVNITTYEPPKPTAPEYINLVGDFNGLSWAGDAAKSPVLYRVLKDGDVNAPYYFGIVSYTPGEYGACKIYYKDEAGTEFWYGIETLAEGVTGITDKDGNFAVPAGVYVVAFDFTAQKSHFLPVESLGFIGGATEKGWDGQTNLTFADGKFTGEVALGEGDYKIRVNDNWNHPFYGGSATDNGFNLGADKENPEKLVYQGDNIKVTETGTFNVTIDVTGNENNVIKLEKVGEGPAPVDPYSKTYNVAGAFNSWNQQDESTIMTAAEDGWLVKSGLAIDGQFKICVNLSWDESYGSGSTLEEGVETLTTNGGENCSVAAGTYDVYFNPATKMVKVVAVGGGSTGDDAIPASYSFISDELFTVTSNTTYYGPLHNANEDNYTTINGQKATGVMVGIKAFKTGTYTTEALGVTGNATLTFVARAKANATQTLYIRVNNGGTATPESLTPASDENMTGTSIGAALTATKADLYTIELSGLTAESTITFSTDANFTDNGSNFGGGNVAVAGIHLTGGTPATPGEPEAEGIKIYAENKAGFSPLNIYSWDANNTQLTGAWPGTAMTETEVVDGVTYNVITVDAKFKGSQIKVIFNDGTSQTPDSEFFTLDGDLYLVADKVDGKFVAPYEAGSVAVVVDFYLKGSFDEWGGGKAMVKENGLYVAKNVTFTGTSSKWGEFKVTDGASAWYGAAGWDPVVIGQPMNISTSEGNNIQISQDGTFDFYFNKEKSQLCVVNAGAAAPSF